MSWQHWILLLLMVANSALVSLAIGEPRKPITPPLAAGIILANWVLIGLLVWGQP